MIVREPGDNAAEQIGYNAMRSLLQLEPRPDGIFCYNDPTAMGAMKGVLDAGPESAGGRGYRRLRKCGVCGFPSDSSNQYRPAQQRNR